MIFIGASAFPEIAELVRDINAAGRERFEFTGILDDDPAWHGKSVEGVPVLGGLAKAAELSEALFVFGIGSHRSRLMRLDILKRLGLPLNRFATLTHPLAKIYSTAHLGIGSIIHAGTVVANGTRVAPFTVILFNCVIGADNVIGPAALVASHVTTNSRVKIGASAFLGSATAVAENVTVGPGAMVGMASAVFRDVPAGAFVLGNPPRTVETVSVPQHVTAAWHEFLNSKGENL